MSCPWLRIIGETCVSEMTKERLGQIIWEQCHRRNGRRHQERWLGEENLNRALSWLGFPGTDPETGLRALFGKYRKHWEKRGEGTAASKGRATQPAPLRVTGLML